MSAIDAYLEAALWSSQDEEGRPLDDTYYKEDINAASRRNAERQVEEFLLEVDELVDQSFAAKGLLPLYHAAFEAPDGERVLADWLQENGIANVRPSEAIDAAHEYVIGAPKFDVDQLGHYFWLNRNGHGTGFWDNEELFGSLAKPLADLSHEFGECWVVPNGSEVQIDCGTRTRRPESRRVVGISRDVFGDVMRSYGFNEFQAIGRRYYFRYPGDLRRHHVVEVEVQFHEPTGEVSAGLRSPAHMPNGGYRNIFAREHVSNSGEAAALAKTAIEAYEAQLKRISP